jgi:hypothetical protein
MAVTRDPAAPGYPRLLNGKGIFMLRTIAATAALLFATAANAQSSAPPEARNSRATALRQSCNMLADTSAKSGFYWVTFDSDHQVLMYCNNEISNQGVRGGWTLVWSNLRGGQGKLASDLHWGASIQTLPRYKGAMITQAAADLQSFEVFTGLRWWRAIMDGGGRREMVYEWSHNYGDLRQVDHRAACSFDLNPADSWMITFNAAACKADVGPDLPELFTTHNGKRWSTVDRDNDEYTDNCSAAYSGSPWWYTACWGGSISGGGERGGAGYFNGAYWRGSDKKWGDADGTGAGNGWIYIR